MRYNCGKQSIKGVDIEILTAASGLELYTKHVRLRIRRTPRQQTMGIHLKYLLPRQLN